MIDLTQHPDAKGFEFPCDTVLVAFGPADDAFRAAIEASVTGSGVKRTNEPVSTRISSGGKFMAVHVGVHVQSRNELEAVYRAINSVPGLKFKL
jgi:putative lipoic acid-binding regulatory protein